MPRASCLVPRSQLLIGLFAPAIQVRTEGKSLREALALVQRYPGIRRLRCHGIPSDKAGEDNTSPTCFTALLEDLELSVRNRGPLPLHLTALTGLTRLAIFSVNVSYKSMAPLSALTWLRELECHSIDRHSLMHVRQLTRLQVLDLSDSPVSKWRIPALGLLVNLTQLDLSNTHVCSLSFVTSLQALWSLNLNNTRPEDLTPLTALPALRRLFATNIYVLYSPLSGTTSLEHLEADSNFLLTPPDAVFLKSLSINVFSVPAHYFVSFSSLTNLETLELHQLTHLGVGCLTALSKLRALSFHFDDQGTAKVREVDDAFLSSIARLSHLTSLSVDMGELSWAYRARLGLLPHPTLVPLLRLKQLRVLCVDLCTNENVEVISNMHNTLRQLTLTNSGFNDIGLQHLSKLVGLERLHLKFCSNMKVESVCTLVYDGSFPVLKECTLERCGDPGGKYYTSGWNWL